MNGGIAFIPGLIGSAGSGGCAGLANNAYQSQIGLAVPQQAQQVNEINRAYADQYAANKPYKTILPKETSMKDDQLLPDISLSRVFKWAVVLIVGMALGKRVWAMFGEKITNNLHKALENN